MYVLKYAVAFSLFAAMVSAGSEDNKRFVSPEAERKVGEVWFGLPPNELQPDSLTHPRAMEATDTLDWSVKYVGAEKAWTKGYTGKGIKVAVIDTGCDVNHKDLRDAIKKVKDFTGSRFGVDDRVGHGTHCAGSIGARKNGWGLQGVAYECDLHIYKGLGDNGSGRSDWIAAAVDEAVKDGCDVISMSLGSSMPDQFLPAAVARAAAKGVLVIAANGNDHGRPVGYPAAYPGAFAISAVDDKGKLADFSNVGAQTKAAGPGVQVRSCYPGPGDGLFADMSGTSMATPNVAGVAALWCQADKGTVESRVVRFEKWLKDTGKPHTNHFGYGVPDAGKLGGEEKPPVVPIPPVVPSAGLTMVQLDALLEAGPVTVYHRVPVGADGFLLLDGPADMPPGKYTVGKETKLKFAPAPK